MARKGNSDGFIHTVYAEGIWWQQQQLSMCVLPEGLFIPCLRLLIFEISIPIDTVPSPITHSYIHWSDLWSLTRAIVTGRGVYIVRRENRNSPRGQAKSNGRLRASGNRRPWFGFTAVTKNGEQRVWQKREREKETGHKNKTTKRKKKSTAFFGVPQFSIQQSQGMQLCVYVS